MIVHLAEPRVAYLLATPEPHRSLLVQRLGRYCVIPIDFCFFWGTQYFMRSPV